jgi:arginine:pyruvate transaminase
MPSASPRFAARVDHLGGEGAEAWHIHYEAKAAKRRGEDVIILSVGDPDGATPAPIVEAAITALTAGDTHYAEVQGRLPVRQAIAARHARHTGTPTGPEHVILTAGAQNAVFAMALCLLQAGDEVLVPQPMYVTYAASIGASGATLVPVPAKAGGFRLDAEALAAAVTPRTRAIFLATPSNPCGTVMTAAELEAVAHIARTHDLWVVSDEVYAELTFEQPHLSIASLPGMAARSATIGSLSKSHAMTGWRVGWAVAPQPLIDHAANLALCMLYGLPGFVQQAALCALTLGDAPGAAARETYRARRDFVMRRLAALPLLDCTAPEAGMFMVIDVSRTGLSANEFAWALLRQAGVSVLDGAAFGREIGHCVRLSLTEPEAVLDEACNRIARFIDSLEIRKTTP